MKVLMENALLYPFEVERIELSNIWLAVRYTAKRQSTISTLDPTLK